MGMAASQARLLTITARIHDVEYQAQSIQNAKVQLATQSDQVYDDYLAALEATTLTVTDVDGNVLTANFNTLCGINKADAVNTYALTDTKGRLIVSEDVYEDYNTFTKYNSGDAYAFAMYCLGANSIGNLNDEENDFTENLAEAEAKVATNSGSTKLENYHDSMVSIMETVKYYIEKQFDAESENSAYTAICNTIDEAITCEESGWGTGFSSFKSALSSAIQESNGDDTLKEYLENFEDTEEIYRYQLYRLYSEDIWTAAGADEIDYDEDAFDYYVSIFKQIQACGGCVSISDYDGTSGDAATDSDWLQSQLQSGKILLSTVTTDSSTGEVTLSTTSPSSDSYVSYTTTTSIDKTALAKAEAEYEYALKQIDKKDEQYDRDLSELDTEREALTTQYDSLKTVINDNIERTFGIFS